MLTREEIAARMHTFLDDEFFERIKAMEKDAEGDGSYFESEVRIKTRFDPASESFRLQTYTYKINNEDVKTLTESQVLTLSRRIFVTAITLLERGK